MKTCYIVGASDFYFEAFKPKAEDFIIAADGGLKHLEKLGITPNFVLGDFDSYGEIPKSADFNDCEVYVAPVEKDDTDTLLALRYAIEKNFKRILIFGGTGGRLDHTFANIQCLTFADRHGVEAFLIGEDAIMTVLSESALTFSGFSGGLAVFSLSETAEVSETGTKYEIENALISREFPIGVSNEFSAEIAEISVKSGEVLLIWTKNTERNLPNRKKITGVF